MIIGTFCIFTFDSLNDNYPKNGNRKITILIRRNFRRTVDRMGKVGTQFPSFLKEEDTEYFKPLIRNQYFPAVKLFVIRNENGRIAAFMGLSDDMLEMLFVLPEEQGHGYGKAFVDYAIDKCNIYKVDVNEDNEQAYKFYLHMGYEVIGRDELDPSGKPFPILHLQQPSSH